MGEKERWWVSEKEVSQNDTQWFSTTCMSVTPSIPNSTGWFCTLWPTLLVGPCQWTTVLFVAGFVFMRCCLCCPVCLLLLVATLCITTHADLSEGLAWLTGCLDMFLSEQQFVTFQRGSINYYTVIIWYVHLRIVCLCKSACCSIIVK